MRLASESKPHEATPQKTRPATSARSSGRGVAPATTPAAPAGVVGMSSTRARSLPRPAGTIPSTPPVPMSAPATAPAKPPPPAATAAPPRPAAPPPPPPPPSTALGGLPGQLSRMVEARRRHRAGVDPVGPQRVGHGGQTAGAAAAPGRRVDDEAHAPVAHGARG